MLVALIVFKLFILESASARLRTSSTIHSIERKHRRNLEYEDGFDLNMRFSKVIFPSTEQGLPLPLTSEDYPMYPANNSEVLDILQLSFCPSVVRLDDYEVYLDVLELIEGDFVGGYPLHVNSNHTSHFWDLMREVIEVQAARRVNNGNDPAVDWMPLPGIWSNYSLDMVAEAVHDEYPNTEQSRNLARMLASGSGFSIDNDIIPQRSRAQFLRGPVMLADLNTWATRIVGPHNFAAKYAIGRSRPEEVAFAIKTGVINAQDVPSDILSSIEAIPNFDNATSFTAYSEGSPMHPSWPAMHSAASQTSFWMDIVLNLSPEELCEARLTDYGVAYARTVAGVHYSDDNIAGLNLGQEVISALLPAYLSKTYGSNEDDVRAKIENARYDWFTFDPENPCPFVIRPRTLPPISVCKPWCASHTSPWIAEPGVTQKCNFENCAGCTECNTVCKSWCYSNTNPWTAEPGSPQKCNWENCAECAECDGV